MSTKTITLTIDSQLDNSRLVGLAIRGLCQLLPLSAEEAQRTELAVVEAVNHTITEAYHNESGNELSLDFSVSPEQLEVQIYDTGDTLDPAVLEASITEPRADDPLSWDQMDSWLTIVRQTVNQLDYYSVGGLNTLVLRKRLAPGE